MASPPDLQRPELGIGLGATTHEALRRDAAAGDAAGMAFVSVGDNPGHLLETVVGLVTLAEVTERCRIGTTMTNPRSRDPLVLASALSSVEQRAPGRVFCGIATGRARGRASVSELRAYIMALRELWSHGRAEYRGQRLELDWDARPVPILIGASGPRALRLAGELGDGAVIETGVSPEVIEQATAAIAEGARSAGRAPDALELWWYLKASLAETSEQAREHARTGLASTAALTLGRDPAGTGVPERFHEHARSAHERYDMSLHVRTDAADPNRELVKDPEFLGYLLDRYGLVGTAEEWRARITELAGRGVRRIFCAAVVPNRTELIETVGRAVLPGLSRLS